MGLLSFFGSVYEHDTLDTRFTTSSSTPYQTVIDARNDPHSKKDAAVKARPRGLPSKWKTPEFYLYYCVLVVVLPYMFWVPYDVSRGTSPPVTIV